MLSQSPSQGLSLFDPGNLVDVVNKHGWIRFPIFRIFVFLKKAMECFCNAVTFSWIFGFLKLSFKVAEMEPNL